jgi:acrylyl-CoA reductase (NADPH)
MFKALLLSLDDKQTRAEIQQLDEARLPDGEVTLRVEYSSLNFKDALAVTGRGAIVKKWPLVPGIDLAGVVEHSSSPDWRPGDRVVINGWGMGESHWGGLAQKARVPASWLLRLPQAYTTRQAMAIATAGYTAALSVLALRRHGVEPGAGEVLVTGAAGGVGSVAVALLANMGFTVAASTGRVQEADYLRRLGASSIIDRAELSEPGKPLQKERWAAVVDSLGGATLANACAQTRSNGAVTACGLAQSASLPATVLPFILRGVTLYGINSVYEPFTKRTEAWDLLAEKLRPELLESMAVEIGLGEVIAYSEKMLDGQVRGRTIVDVNR